MRTTPEQTRAIAAADIVITRSGKVIKCKYADVADVLVVDDDPLPSRAAYDIDGATDYLRTGGLGEVIGFTDLYRELGFAKVQLDTDMAVALCVLACEGMKAGALAPVAAEMADVLIRMSNEVRFSGLGEKAGFDVWLNVADTALAAYWSGLKEAV